MAQSTDNISWWAALLPGFFLAIAPLLTMIVILRKRRWRDHKLLAKPAKMPVEHLTPEPRAVKDMLVGEEAYVDRSAITTSKRGRRVFVGWDDKLRDAPRASNDNDFFAPLPIRRLERGFSITVRPGDTFRTGPVPWGMYAPVIEILQAAPPTVSSSR